MNTPSKDILSLLINLENLLKSESQDKFDIKLKVLHLVQENENTSPNFLIEKLGMARSNLAIMCNKLVKENLIKKQSKSQNKKEIFYTITVKGSEFLNAHYARADETINKLRHINKILKLTRDLDKILK